MQTSDIDRELTTSRFPNRWAWFPVGLLGLLVSVQLVLFGLSSGDESFAIEPEYYQKAVDWDARMRVKQASERLGWSAKAAIDATLPDSTLRLRLLDERGEPLPNAAVTVDAFANSRAALVQHLTLREESPGVYDSPVRVTHRGEWEVRVAARRGSDAFATTLRVSTQAGVN